ncbi:hypothetical protein N665_0532s0008 [Sinapis alba]|nr:hypothetical protein N665_0532s0008 [Sinapis alba]
MPLEYTPISQLNSSQKEWKIRVLVLLIWDYYSKHKPDFVPGMEVILVDEKKLIKKNKKELKEGEYLDVMNFEVLGNNDDYRGTTHPYKITFIYTTYSNVDDVFIDIVGEIVGMGEITDRNYARNLIKLLDIQLRDLSGFNYKNNKTGPITLLGSLMRTKKYNACKISVQNSRFSIKIFLNEDINEITEFKKGMVKTDILAPFTVSLMVTPTSLKKFNDSFPLSCWKTINYTCVTFATILAFQKERPWWYVGWKGCFSTATPYFNPLTEEIEANKYSCDTCEKNETTTSIRYKVQVKVADHTGSTSLILFDREVIQLIHKSAYELLEQQVQFNRENEVPQELMDLEGRKIASIIHVKGTKKNYQSKNNDLPPCSLMNPTTKRPLSHMIDDEGIQESSTKFKGTSKMAKGESGKKRVNVKKESTK